MSGSIMIKKALELGFEEALLTVSEDGRLVLVCFLPYGMSAGEAAKGHVRLSNYYRTAPVGEKLQKKLIVFLREHGIEANPRAQTYKDYKKLALRGGGVMRRNGFFYHPRLGSMLHIRITDIHGNPQDYDIAESVPEPHNCGKCEICMNACPGGAISKDGLTAEKCFRVHMGKAEIPPEHGKKIYQLLGCEICQSVCPHNKTRVKAQVQPQEFDLLALLEEKQIRSVIDIASPTFATRQAVLNQAIFIAANRKYLPALAAVRALEEDADCGAAAKYASGVLRTEE